VLLEHTKHYVSVIHALACLTVCLSITRWNSIKMAKYIIMQTAKVLNNRCKPPKINSTTLKELFSNVDARCILDFTKDSGFYRVN